MSKLHFSIQEYQLTGHYLQVELEIMSPRKEITLSLPVWSPGSYMVRDYSRHIHKLEVSALGKNRKRPEVSQIDLDSWSVLCEGTPFLIRYVVYGYDYSVRSNYFTTEFCLLHPPALFLYPKDEKVSEITLEISNSLPFEFCHSGLDGKGKKRFSKNLDEFLDAPILLSNRAAIPFHAGECVHEIVLEGELSKSVQKTLIPDLQKITEEQIRSFAGSPNNRYLFILILSEGAYGGLEHLNSSVNMYDPLKAISKDGYLKLLELLSHEYFHLWNVKRIRPITLGPFDYQKPNLTRELWIAEGITSFYDAYFLVKTKHLNAELYLAKVMEDLLSLEKSEGESWMSLEDSSFTAWTKFYNRPNDPNANNTGVSYYVKGSILALAMNLHLLSESSGDHSLLDVMNEVYQTFHLGKNRGFTKIEFFEAAKKRTGIDLKSEFGDYLDKPIPIPIEKYFHKIGVRRSDSNPEVELGFGTREDKGNLIIHKIDWKFLDPSVDLSQGDEWIALNGTRIHSGNRKNLLKQFRAGEKVELLISRKGKILKRKMKLSKRFQTSQFKFEEQISEKQKRLRNLFFGIK
ncbi:M61 family metallopeptidase [Leptospira borgpetersenii]|uniref:M61 family metallopeptidase n=1 Tax=Leptospira borgpetersenii TaxID=174 RepID=UPI000772E0B6|nr:M61 family metallopeptidase [Leptospira borgpetersenii]MBE8401550.1 M61 family metallopeptidase [Leptospira borgpetersenii serovar Tarassovi]MBE8404041.1 M61 family metallopeptidase [Leptospira borgpetersenii serovar Tarassovi]MBE8407102.1 M61 family metallopeptidase [Leptospira borgpetersenii serovar Tarassovi]MBE8413954.1 M61 family metallopeptidase [Leptospira borgpetersenii serovar Tarassovi]MBE8417276.1 M61 family metallopeptidase [Leptospira borgpetersenii serovar Tarassovi]